MLKSKPAALAVMESMAAASEMDEAAEYLVRGRIYERCSSDWLARRWVQEFRSWFHSELPRSFRPVADIRAEMALRGLQPPYNDVREELEQSRRDAMEADRHGAAAMKRAVDAYHAHGLAN